MESVRDQIVARIERLGEGKAFSAKDFLDIASRTTSDVTLAELARKGTVRRIRRGLYDMPRVNPALGGTLSPDIDEAARARLRGDNARRSCRTEHGPQTYWGFRRKRRQKSST